ncbi:MAG: hypothetical protein P4M09_00070 [Devosia sp.]|nr:hypothetical protein [Devosia sp.]
MVFDRHSGDEPRASVGHAAAHAYGGTGRSLVDREVGDPRA